MTKTLQELFGIDKITEASDCFRRERCETNEDFHNAVDAALGGLMSSGVSKDSISLQHWPNGPEPKLRISVCGIVKYEVIKSESAT